MALDEEQRHPPGGDWMGEVPPPLSWEEYEERVGFEWPSLLNRGEVAEKDIQAFLEENPALVPGARGFHGGHHGPIHDVLFTQPQLPGIRRPVPDFMWVVRDSEAVRPILIEIEAPQKRWFKGSGLLTDELTQALSQLSDWKEWFSHDANRANFRDLYRLNDRPFRDRPLVPTYCLIYGRYEEFADAPELITRRRGMRPEDTEWMTFDGLAPDAYAKDCFVVRAPVASDFVAISASPTLRLGEMNAEEFAPILRRDEAIAANRYMSEGRKAFLRSRLPHWDSWAEERTKGMRRRLTME